jgi:hypothetical protein
MVTRLARLTGIALAALLVASASGCSPSSGTSPSPLSTTIPASPAGAQLRWLLGIAPELPLSNAEISAHFDSTFLAQASPDQLNQAFASLGPPGSPVTLVQVTDVDTVSLQAVIRIGPARYSVALSVDPTGLIAGLLFRPVGVSVPDSWSQVDGALAGLAPGVSLLAATVGSDGSCSPVHAVDAGTARPLASMFKLFVLGALATAVADGQISWTQTVTVTAADKVEGSADLQNVADGTTLTVQEAALDMISVSDNTAADLLLNLVGPAAVEAQVSAWASDPSLDVPFLTVQEMVTLKYDDFPALANDYLALSPSQRAAYLASTIDAVPSSALDLDLSQPRDIDSIEWFASADDVCRALAGLDQMETEPGLSQLDPILSTNSGGISLSSTTWPRIWFKGGSEPGVLTLGYLARDQAGTTYAVILLTEDAAQPVQESLAAEEEALDIVAGAFQLMR